MYNIEGIKNLITAIGKRAAEDYTSYLYTLMEYEEEYKHLRSKKQRAKKLSKTRFILCDMRDCERWLTPYIIERLKEEAKFTGCEYLIKEAREEFLGGKT